MKAFISLLMYLMWEKTIRDHFFEIWFQKKLSCTPNLSIIYLTKWCLVVVDVAPVLKKWNEKKIYFQKFDLFGNSTSLIRAYVFTFVNCTLNTSVFRNILFKESSSFLDILTMQYTCIHTKLPDFFYTLVSS